MIKKGICGDLPNSNLTGCTLYFNTAGLTAGYYAAAVEIEDFKTTSSTAAMCSVPEQFLFEVIDQTDGCTSM
jgi:hypothetical protein